MDVGVRELKQHLSAYLDRVARGEHFRVTHRGRPKAMLTPIVVGAVVDRGIEEGWIRPGEKRPPQRLQRTTSHRSVLELVGEDRDGR